MKRVLAIGAHFDDVELGAGGSLAKWKSNGCEVYKLTLTDNVTNFKEKDINVEFQESFQQSLKACEKLGIIQLEPEEYYPCTKLVFNSQRMQVVEKIIFEKDIDTVLIHFESDLQQDHVEASKISIIAARYCPRVLFYQSNRYILPKDFYPRFFVDITEFQTKKFEALNFYRGSHDRMGKLFEQTKLQNQIWGHQIKMNRNKNYAEGFKIHKWLI